ncbi:DUF2798 domain-containing protein [Spongiibacter nanhainus]|uniref:DUF2798 domain-containing protein n=1 Tax=Spongiibacter nanhainus TaxID=2794344 RepID=A0A7T4UPC8_9GAMM|nr:DUF2798 domain-containing protein [Spongiibacter nanhainus]QQD17467.1 DUF2798 domain-containing protein [Spongiibacter nanhainus]
MICGKYFHYVFVALMSMGMTLILSLFATANNEGQSGNFVWLWLLAAALNFAIAFPTALAVAPVARWAAGKLTTTTGRCSDR